MGDTILCIAAAMVGAGFASGQEIMQFFSQYGAFSWALVILAAIVMGLIIQRILSRRCENTFSGRSLLSLFYVAVGGGMTAAAGELWALTVPFHYARTLGSVITLIACLRLAEGSLQGMVWLGRILLPLLLSVLILCLRAPGTSWQKTVPIWEGVLAVLSVVGYCGLNGMIAAGVLSGSRSRKEQNKISVAVGLLTALLLGLGNAALLPHAGTLSGAVLPTVSLLRAYGKTGFYLSAAVLYLAAATTLIAVLRGLLTFSAPYLAHYRKTLVGFALLTVSMLGFQDIVRAAYPALGWAYLMLLFFPTMKKENRVR
ncbi:MAG: hypothetical protein IKN04_02130 [Clostridia bacterium]|nr:hypothetical protein [Clostridia bacterium]